VVELVPERVPADGLRERAAEGSLDVAGDWVVGEAWLLASVSCGLDLGERLG
jgi:hypothetical protein